MTGQGGRRNGRKILPRRIIFFHILPRLPVSSLQRCRSVCKQWHSFLNSRFFADIHNRRLTHGSSLRLPPKLLLFLPSVHPWSGFRIMDCEPPAAAGDDDADGSVIAGGQHPLPFVAADKYYIRALTFLHGLVCIWLLKENRNLDTDLVLWNPLTGESKTLCITDPYLKKLTYFTHQTWLGLYYNAADDDYKLLFISSYDPIVQIYSLKSESWRNVDSPDNYQILSLFKPGLSSNGSWINGNLYFLYNKRTLGSFNDHEKRGRPSIIKFDTKIEKLSVIPTDPCLMDLDVKHVSMNVEEDAIYLGVKYETGRHIYSTNAYIQMWRMMIATPTGDNNWEKVGGQYRVDNCMEPLQWMGNKTWLMIKNNGRDIYKVDQSKGTCSIVSNSMPATATVKYTETFMSLDRSTQKMIK